MAMTHQVKCWPAPFRDVVQRQQSFQVRRDDRGYKPGDYLWLKEWNPDTQTYTGQSQIFDIHSVLRAGEHGLPGLEAGYCVLGIGL